MTLLSGILAMKARGLGEELLEHETNTKNNVRKIASHALSWEQKKGVIARRPPDYSSNLCPPGGVLGL